MLNLIKVMSYMLVILIVLFPRIIIAEEKVNIPILCYHNLNPTTRGSMNLTPEKFESQLRWIQENGFTVIPLKIAVDYLQGKQVTLPAKPVVITFDDGWKSAYTYLPPLVKKYHIPVTLFIYPETISHGKNAMRWEDLKELQQMGFFDIQGHTYSHPNFKKEKRKLSPLDFEKFVKKELVTSKQILENKLGTKVIFLAWPFGIYDPYLEQEATKAGYIMAFSIDARTANRNHRPMAQPRFMIIDMQSMKTFAGIVNQSKGKETVVNAKNSVK